MYNLPFELIHVIYSYSDIDTKQSFNKIFKHESFIHNKICIYDKYKLLEQILNFKYLNYILITNITETFLFNN